MNLMDLLRKSTEWLQEKGVTHARRVVEELVAHAFHCSRMDLYLQYDKPIKESELALLRPLLKRAATHEPPAYIIGEVPFFHCTVSVSPDVLIPRPETEVLLSYVCKKSKPTAKVAWDLCCGSGAMGIALKKAMPQLQVAFSDLSDRALNVAKENAKKNEIEGIFYQGDLFAPFLGQKADIVLVNPPYVSEEEFAFLDRSVKEFEPKEALLGGRDGLHFYRRLAQEMPPYLHPGAQIFLEIGASQGESVRSLFTEPHWHSPCLERDWSGQDRFFFIEFV